MDNKIQTNPPYGSINRLKYVFDLFKTHSLSTLNPSDLRSRGFSGSDAFQTIASLKFLGIIDADGKSTEKMKGLQLIGDKRATAIADIVKQAYSKLFDTVSEPNKLNKDELHNDFVSLYNLSGRLATTAVPNFLWLCKEAGLEVEEAPEVKEYRSRNRQSVSSKQPKSKHEQSEKEKPSEKESPKGNLVEVGEFELLIPEDWDTQKTRQAVVMGDFSVIYSELIKLSTKLRKNGGVAE